MIFVTVGTGREPFDRLLYEIDRLAPEFGQSVVIQKGCSSFQPKHAKTYDYLSEKNLTQYLQHSVVVITHAGAGSLIKILHLGKRPVVVPRLKKYGEVINDHQLEISRVLEKQRLIIPVYDIKMLLKSIKKALANPYSYPRHKGYKNQLVAAIRKEISITK